MDESSVKYLQICKWTRWIQPKCKAGTSELPVKQVKQVHTSPNFKDWLLKIVRNDGKFLIFQRAENFGASPRKILFQCLSGLVIQVWNSKIYFNMEALGISCRNKQWSKYFHLILISSTGYLTICPAVLVQAALEPWAACTTMARHIVR